MPAAGAAGGAAAPAAPHFGGGGSSSVLAAESLAPATPGAASQRHQQPRVSLTPVSAGLSLSGMLEDGDVDCGGGDAVGAGVGSTTIKAAYLALVWSRDTLGYALYEKHGGVVVIGECREFDAFLNVQELKAVHGPCAVVVPAGADPRFVAAAKACLPDGYSPETSAAPAQEFSPDAAYAKLAEQLGLPAAEDGKVYLAERVDLRAYHSLRALGGLLVRVAGVGAITAVTPAALTQTLAMDPRSFQALQVFKRVAHPSAHNGIGSSKEGLSLYGLLNVCKTKMGSELLRRWMQAPTRDISRIEARQRAIDALTSPHNHELVASLRDHLRFWRDPGDLLKKFTEYSASVRHWQALFQAIYTYPAIVELCRKLDGGSGCACFARVHKTFEEARIGELFRTLHNAIDLPMSQHSGRVVIKFGVDEELDRHKHAYDGLGNFLEEVAKVVVREIGAFDHPISVDYYPQLGYFTTVGVGYFNKHLTTDLPVAGYDFQFKSDDRLFYKTARMRELDAKYGDIYSAIVDMEAEVEARLTQTVIAPDNQRALLAARCLAEVDCLAAMAVVAREEQWCRPTVVPNNVLRIVDGRHPLQEKVVDRFVPNDSVAGETSQRVHVVTGPNASGKSVYLKQVAVCVYLAHIGSYVPAKEATIGTTDRIFTRIASRHPRATDGPCSAFSTDLEDVNAMVRYATPRSLLVVDEFGKGTVAADGIALLAAVTRHFLNLGGTPPPHHPRQRVPASATTTAPHVGQGPPHAPSFFNGRGDAGAASPTSPKLFVSTHFVEMLENDLVPETHPLLRVAHMAVESAEEDERAGGGKLVFRFKVREGRCDSHFAAYCASRAGVPRAITTRAAHILHLLKKKLPLSVLRRLLMERGPTDTARLRNVMRALAGHDMATCDVAALRVAVMTAAQGDEGSLQLTAVPQP